MLKFQYDFFLWFLLLVPLLFWVYKKYIREKDSILEKYFKPENLSEIRKKGEQSSNSPYILLAAIAALIIAIANIQKGSFDFGTGTAKGGDIMVAVDVSQSMSARDVSPSRMELSKLFLDKLLKKAGSNRLGLLYFAWTADIAMPLSNDLITFREELDKLEPGIARAQGTSIANALEDGLYALEQSNYKYRALLLITDGEDHEEGINKLIRQYRNKGIKIFTVGVGSEKGAQLIDEKTGERLLDNNGEPVTSKFNQSLLKDIAKKTNGSFIYLDNIRSAKAQVLDQIAAMGSNTYNSSNFVSSKSYGYIFLLIALILLLVEFRPLFFVARKSSAILLLIFFPVLLHAQEEYKDLRQGNAYYKKGDFKKAQEFYSKLLKIKPDDLKANYNQGNSYYSMQNMDLARQYWTKSLETAKTKEDKSRAHYNIGNSYCIQKQWDQAIESYKSALRLRPEDESARYNLAYAQRMKKQDQQQNKKKQDQQQQNKNQQQNQDQEKNKDDKDKQDQQNQDQQNNDQQNQNPDKGDQENKGDQQKNQQRPSNMTKEQAEQLLDALRSRQKKVKLQNQEKDEKYAPPSKTW